MTTYWVRTWDDDGNYVDGATMIVEADDEEGAIRKYFERFPQFDVAEVFVDSTPIASYAKTGKKI